MTCPGRKQGLSIFSSQALNKSVLQVPVKQNGAIILESEFYNNSILFQNQMTIKDTSRDSK